MTAQKINISSTKDTTHKIELTLKEENGVYILKTNLYGYLPEYGARMVNTEVLGMAFEPEQYFENPDGTSIIFNEDYYGNHRQVTPVAGPFEEKKEEYILC